MLPEQTVVISAVILGADNTFKVIFTEFEFGLLHVALSRHTAV